MTSGAQLLSDIARQALLQSPVAAVCLFAWWKGGRPERYGAAIYAASVTISMLIAIAVGLSFPGAPVLAVDFAAAVGFLLLAIRFNSMWLGAAMLLKGVQLALHAIHLTDRSDPVIAGYNLYAVALNLVAVLLMALFVTATIASTRRRGREIEASGRTALPYPLA